MSVRIDTQLRGPFFTKDVKAEVIAGVNEGLEAIALEGQALVQAQLSVGHGVLTGHFRRSIHGGLVRSLHAQVDAGLVQQGANVIYTHWLETGVRRGAATAFPGYHMFEEAAMQLEHKDLSGFIAWRVVRRLT